MTEEKLQINKRTQAERDAMDRMLNSKRGRNKLAEKTEHTGLPVAGYKTQPDVNVRIVNAHKELEELVLRVMDAHKTKTSIDQRWLAIARTQMEQAFMALNRAVFQPGRVKLADTTLDYLQTVIDATDSAI
jgi:hypothetical protein